jgi:bacterioferritin (cytochrome b1)
MDTQSDSLNDVLRCEMTAVNQQFIHVLALREWGDDETADRIMQVDRVDFPNAMRIIDYLVETKTPIDLVSDRFTPGANYESILLSEQTIERRLSAAIDKADCTDDRARALVSTAEAPRAAYAKWLTDRLNGANRGEAGGTLVGTETAGVVAHLIAMIEQTMVHAFLHWHGGDPDGADAAWASSGAAMMHMTGLVHLFAAHGTVPVPGEFPALQISDGPAEALDLDCRLAARCADEAAMASDRSEEIALADLCRKIADRCLELSRWNPGQAHPAAGNIPAAFSSFEATLKKQGLAKIVDRVGPGSAVR